MSNRGARFQNAPKNKFVIPAKAGIQENKPCKSKT
jgi:hypothetical protein